MAQTQKKNTIIGTLKLQFGSERGTWTPDFSGMNRTF